MTTTATPWRVRMTEHISGGRGDGTEWPAKHGFLVCGQQEAEDLVRAKLATDAMPLPGGQQDADSGSQPSGDDGEGDGGSGPENGSEGTGEDGKPLVRDPKQAWVDHAVAQGADPETAAAMTKADLIAQYGNPA